MFSLIVGIFPLIKIHLLANFGARGGIESSVSIYSWSNSYAV